MSDACLRLPEDEAKALYRHIHRVPLGQETFCETYRQLQALFFQTMTVEEVVKLLEAPE